MLGLWGEGREIMDFKWDDQVNHLNQEYPIYAECDDGVVHLVIIPTSDTIVTICGYQSDQVFEPDGGRMCALCLNIMDRIAVERGRDTIITLGREDQAC